ncbi:hypothetical protein MKX01_035514 [Papaver californicum]|nr:hypothetical protein MKX01_035514 [Papaver californicum]
MFASTSVVDVKGAYWLSWLYTSSIIYTLLLHSRILRFCRNQFTKLPTSCKTRRRSMDDNFHYISSFGGGSSDRSVFAAMASSPSNRANFITSTIQVARKYGFDGLDLDWEYPVTRAEMVLSSLNGVKLLTKRLILSTKLTTYPAQAVHDSLDFVNLMCYDYRGDWDTSKTGKTWKLKDPNVNGIGSTAVGVGPGAGILTYANVVDFNGVSGTRVVYDAQTVSM